MIKMKTKILLPSLLFFVFLLSSCTMDRNNPGYAYMPDLDMYYTKFAKAYAANDILPNNMVNQPAPAGVVARGMEYYPFHPENVAEKVVQKDKAGEVLINPIPATDESIAEGKRQYKIFCADCHGVDLKGNGYLYAQKLFPAKPQDLTSDYIQNMKDGSLFYSITEGSASGLMGPHGTQITPENRWNIINYLRSVVK